MLTSSLLLTQRHASFAPTCTEKFCDAVSTRTEGCGIVRTLSYAAGLQIRSSTNCSASSSKPPSTVIFSGTDDICRGHGPRSLLNLRGPGKDFLPARAGLSTGSSFSRCSPRRLIYVKSGLFDEVLLGDEIGEEVRLIRLRAREAGSQAGGRDSVYLRIHAAKG